MDLSQIYLSERVCQKSYSKHYVKQFFHSLPLIHTQAIYM